MTRSLRRATSIRALATTAWFSKSASPMERSGMRRASSRKSLRVLCSALSELRLPIRSREPMAPTRCTAWEVATCSPATRATTRSTAVQEPTRWRAALATISIGSTTLLTSSSKASTQDGIRSSPPSPGHWLVNSRCSVCLAATTSTQPAILQTTPFTATPARTAWTAVAHSIRSSVDRATTPTWWTTSTTSLQSPAVAGLTPSSRP